MVNRSRKKRLNQVKNLGVHRFNEKMYIVFGINIYIKDLCAGVHEIINKMHIEVSIV